MADPSDLGHGKKVLMWRKCAKSLFPTKLNVWTTRQFGFQDQYFREKANKIVTQYTSLLMYVQNAKFDKT